MLTDVRSLTDDEYVEKVIDPVVRPLVDDLVRRMPEQPMEYIREWIKDPPPFQVSLYTRRRHFDRVSAPVLQSLCESALKQRPTDLLDFLSQLIETTDEVKRNKGAQLASSPNRKNAQQQQMSSASASQGTYRAQIAADSKILELLQKGIAQSSPPVLGNSDALLLAQIKKIVNEHEVGGGGGAGLNEKRAMSPSPGGGGGDKRSNMSPSNGRWQKNEKLKKWQQTVNQAQSQAGAQGGGQRNIQITDGSEIVSGGLIYNGKKQQGPQLYNNDSNAILSGTGKHHHHHHHHQHGSNSSSPVTGLASRTEPPSLPPQQLQKNPKSLYNSSSGTTASSGGKPSSVRRLTDQLRSLLIDLDKEAKDGSTVESIDLSGKRLPELPTRISRVKREIEMLQSERKQLKSQTVEKVKVLEAQVRKTQERKMSGQKVVEDVMRTFLKKTQSKAKGLEIQQQIQQINKLQQSNINKNKPKNTKTSSSSQSATSDYDSSDVQAGKSSRTKHSNHKTSKPKTRLSAAMADVQEFGEAQVFEGGEEVDVVSGSEMPSPFPAPGTLEGEHGTGQYNMQQTQQYDPYQYQSEIQYQADSQNMPEFPPQDQRPPGVQYNYLGQGTSEQPGNPGLNDLAQMMYPQYPQGTQQKYQLQSTENVIGGNVVMNRPQPQLGQIMPENMTDEQRLQQIEYMNSLAEQDQQQVIAQQQAYAEQEAQQKEYYRELHDAQFDPQLQEHLQSLGSDQEREEYLELIEHAEQEKGFGKGFRVEVRTHEKGETKGKKGSKAQGKKGQPGAKGGAGTSQMQGKQGVNDQSGGGLQAQSPMSQEQMNQMMAQEQMNQRMAQQQIASSTIAQSQFSDPQQQMLTQQYRQQQLQQQQMQQQQQQQSQFQGQPQTAVGQQMSQLQMQSQQELQQLQQYESQMQNASAYQMAMPNQQQQYQQQMMSMNQQQQFQCQPQMPGSMDQQLQFNSADQQMAMNMQAQQMQQFQQQFPGSQTQQQFDPQQQQFYQPQRMSQAESAPQEEFQEFQERPSQANAIPQVKGLFKQQVNESLPAFKSHVNNAFSEGFDFKSTTGLTSANGTNNGNCVSNQNQLSKEHLQYQWQQKELERQQNQQRMQQIQIKKYEEQQREAMLQQQMMEREHQVMAMMMQNTNSMQPHAPEDPNDNQEIGKETQEYQTDLNTNGNQINQVFTYEGFHGVTPSPSPQKKSTTTTHTVKAATAFSERYAQNEQSINHDDSPGSASPTSPQHPTIDIDLAETHRALKEKHSRMLDKIFEQKQAIALGSAKEAVSKNEKEKNKISGHIRGKARVAIEGMLSNSNKKVVTVNSVRDSNSSDNFSFRSNSPSDQKGGRGAPGKLKIGDNWLKRRVE